jgi:hypothetical protein
VEVCIPCCYVSFFLLLLHFFSSPRTQPAETSERAERTSRRRKHDRDTATADGRDAEEEKERKRETKTEATRTDDDDDDGAELRSQVAAELMPGFFCGF